MPGWDCHGLPIEWKIEEKYRAEGKSKDDVPIAMCCAATAAPSPPLARCAARADQAAGLHRRLGAGPTPRWTFRAEAVIARELHKFVENGLLYRGFRPVMWSPVEKTALADAEVEYHEKTSPTIYVKFPLSSKRARTTTLQRSAKLQS